MATYLFDFDGTLVDSMPTYCAMVKKVLEDEHIPYGPDLMKIVTPLGFAGTADYMIERLGLPLPREEILCRMQDFAGTAYATTIPAKEDVPEVLRALSARGDRLNILTASPHANLDPCLKRLGLWELFDHVWSCEDFGTGKSDPAIYRAAAERMGVPVESVIFLDDNLNADLTAKSVGMQVYGVYDDSSAEYVDQIKAATDRYITRFSELLVESEGTV
ncbi:MAG: HAD family phosphatase [Oscillospiraceae bacterium]|nr:HAD family phosphatase [Oscillospiraceae bacterium]